MKMKGYAMLGIGKTGWIEKERPECGPLDAIVRPIAVSPCTSDVHTVWEGAIGDRDNMILGHEAVGIVEEVGELVVDFKPGDRVIVSAITPDWSAKQAQRGYPMHSGGMLSGWKFSNFKDGVFAEYFHVNDADGNLALLPDGMSLEAATMICDMMPTGFHGAEMAEIEFGDDVAVIGNGPVGLMAIAGAALRGAANVFAVDSRPFIVPLAKEYGATQIVDFKKRSMVDQVMELTHGRGADKVIICGGDVNTMADAIRMLKPGGTVSNVNYIGTGDGVMIPRTDWGCGMSHKKIHCGLMPGGRVRSEKLASMVTQGRVDPGKLITHVFHGFEHMEEALNLMRPGHKPPDLIKPLVILD